MLVSYTWLKDYVDIDTDPQELADKLTMVGLEVSSVRRLGPELDGVVVGYVEYVELTPIRQAVLCRVNVGRNQALHCWGT